MKKNSFILWISSVIIVFVTAYSSNLFNDTYPITSSFSIEGKKISYRFERIHYGKDGLKVMVRSELKDIKGKLFWQTYNGSSLDSIKMNYKDTFLFGRVPSLQPRETEKYFVKLYYKNKIYTIPFNRKVNVTFYGKISPALNVLEFLLLYLGLIFAVRTGMECFNGNKNLKKLGVFTLIFLITLTFLVNPLYLTYKLGFMNHIVPPIRQLFYTSDFAIILIWIITVVFTSKSKKLKYFPLVPSIITLVLFFFFR